jgi:eukaryotic-like serine/threonine-protein kinase
LTTIDTLPKTGDLVAGKYRIENVLGEGGMGIVVAARHEKLDQRVAIKFVTLETDDAMLMRFEREGRAIAQLKGEHVTRVFDIGELEDGTPYMVMEHLDGSDLRARVKKGGPLPVEEAVDYVLQTCEALAEAHAAGIIHRDLKPANLFLTRTPDGSHLVKVLDFGISKDTKLQNLATGEDDLTKTSALLGTPHFMAPEQMRSARTVDARADIWSLGAILYQLVTAKRPFAAGSLPELFIKVIQEDPPPPSTRGVASIPPEIDQIVARCMQKSRKKRFADVAELAQALVPLGPPWASEVGQRCARLLGHEEVSQSLPPLSRSSGRPSGSYSGMRDLVVSAPGEDTVSSARTIQSQPPSASQPPSSLASASLASASVASASVAPSSAAASSAAPSSAAPLSAAPSSSVVPASRTHPSEPHDATDVDSEVPIPLSQPASDKIGSDTAAAVTSAPTSRTSAEGSKRGVWIAVAVAAVAAVAYLGMRGGPEPPPVVAAPATDEASAVPSEEAAPDDSALATTTASASSAPSLSVSAPEPAAPMPVTPPAANPPDPVPVTPPPPPAPEPPPPPAPPPPAPKPAPPVAPPPPPPQPPPPAQPKKSPLDMELK